jgi:hypothetical protein
MEIRWSVFSQVAARICFANGRSHADRRISRESKYRISKSPSCSVVSHHADRGVEVRKNGDGLITDVRIGRWRTLVASPKRRLAEVRELGCGRVAVRIERLASGASTPSSEIWHLYDLDGRLNEALQSAPNGRFASMPGDQAQQAWRLAANLQRELQVAETRAI